MSINESESLQTQTSTRREYVVAAIRAIFHRDVDLICGYLSYTTILSIIPFIVLLLAVGKAFGNPMKDTYVLANRFLDLITPDGAERLRGVISELYRNIHIRRYGVSATIPLLLLIFHKIRVLRQAFAKLVGDGPNLSIFWELLIFVVIIVTFPLAFSVLDTFILSQLPRKGAFLISNLSKIVSGFVIIFLLMRVFLPTRAPRGIELIMAFIGALALALGNKIFALLSTHFFQVSRMYGVFTSAALFLIWIYIFWRILVSCIVLASDKWQPGRS